MNENSKEKFEKVYLCTALGSMSVNVILVITNFWRAKKLKNAMKEIKQLKREHIEGIRKKKRYLKNLNKIEDENYFF